MPIIIKSDDEIAIMREAGSIVAQTLQRLVQELRPGLVVKELDKVVRKEFGRCRRPAWFVSIRTTARSSRPSPTCTRPRCPTACP